MQNNKIIEMAFYNKKGIENGKEVFTISDTKKEGGELTSIVSAEMFDKSGKSIAKTSDKIYCDRGTLKIDMKLFIPSQQMEQIKTMEAALTAAYLEYPSSMKVGDELPDGKININFTNNGMEGTLVMSITDRSVDDEETITSPVGTWEAYKITYNSKIKVKVAGIGIPIYSDITEWYVPDFGIVKTESSFGTTLITAIH